MSQNKFNTKLVFENRKVIGFLTMKFKKKKKRKKESFENNKIIDKFWNNSNVEIKQKIFLLCLKMMEDVKRLYLEN